MRDEDDDYIDSDDEELEELELDFDKYTKDLHIDPEDDTEE